MAFSRDHIKAWSPGDFIKNLKNIQAVIVGNFKKLFLVFLYSKEKQMVWKSYVLLCYSIFRGYLRWLVYCEVAVTVYKCSPGWNFSRGDFKKTGMKMINSDGDAKNILGVEWDLSKDEFIFTFSDITETAESLPVSKKNILKTSAMFFDPLGLICP